MPLEKGKRRQLYVLQVKYAVDRECLTVLERAWGLNISIRYWKTNTWNGHFHEKTAAEKKCNELLEERTERWCSKTCETGQPIKSGHTFTKPENPSNIIRGNHSGSYPHVCLILILLTWIIWWAPNNASRWQMEFNSAFKGLILDTVLHLVYACCIETRWSYGSKAAVRTEHCGRFLIWDTFSDTTDS
jgi:hypothetical protein